MIKKIFSVCVCLTSTVALTWCFWWWSSDEWQPITFDTFNLTIGADYESIPPALVENKQIINKVLRSFKLPNPEWFDKNIVVTKSTIEQEIDYEQFATANEQKLSSQLVWYTAGDKELFVFSCLEEDDTTWIYAQFEITDPFYKTSDQYYIHQYQFVANDYGYIISYATDESWQEKLFKNILKSLECDKTQEQTTN